jgi:hypothetical protein
VKSLEGSRRIGLRHNVVDIFAALLLGPMLVTGVGWAYEAVAPDTWAEQRVETAFHDILAHGELSYAIAGFALVSLVGAVLLGFLAFR